MRADHENPWSSVESDAFYAVAAVLNAAARNHALLPDVFCPGLCTGTGRVSAADAASEMAHAYAKWVRKGSR